MTDFKNRLQAIGTGLLLAITSYTGLAHAVDYSLSGFGTVQYTTGDNEANYLRFANKNGTLKVNSILGAQLDAQFTQQLSATVQYAIAPKQDNDKGIELDARWAFVKWRPTDNWTLRVGRQRLNFYLDSENLEVGQTYTPANLSPEIYFNGGVLQIDGATLAYKFEDHAGRYWGIQVVSGDKRIAQRKVPTDTDFPFIQAGVRGISVYVEGENYRALASHHEAEGTRDVSSRVGAMTLQGYLGANVHFTNLGYEYNWDRYTLRAELAQQEIDTVVQVTSPIRAILADDPQFEEHGGNLTLIRNLNHGHAVYGSTSRYISEFDDQYSLALGFKYALSDSQSIKAELMQITEKQTRAQLSDNRIPNTRLYLFSLSYNWVF